jgi:hypothetical protein
LAFFGAAATASVLRAAASARALARTCESESGWIGAGFGAVLCVVDCAGGLPPPAAASGSSGRGGDGLFGVAFVRPARAARAAIRALRSSIVDCCVSVGDYCIENSTVLSIKMPYAVVYDQSVEAVVAVVAVVVKRAARL